jgi:hypothetical protein
VKPATTAMARAGFLSLRCARGKDGHQMDLQREETRGVAREGVPPTDQGAPGSSAPAAPYRTTHLLALDREAAAEAEARWLDDGGAAEETRDGVPFRDDGRPG